MKAWFSTREQPGQEMMFEPPPPRPGRGEAAGGNVGEDLAARFDLLVLARRRHRQRNADRVADAQRNKLLQGLPGLDDALGRHARFGHA